MYMYGEHVLTVTSFEIVSVFMYMLIVGLFCIRYPELMLVEDVKQLYTDWLTKESHSSNKKLEVHVLRYMYVQRLIQGGGGTLGLAVI